MTTLTRRKTTKSYDAKFYAAHESGSIESAKQVVPMLLDLIGMKSVCDVGCGIGSWLEVFIDEGISDVLGLDGEHVDNKMLRIPASKFQPRDLNRPFSVDRTFDAVISLEVAEHLSLERAAGFVNDLTALSSVVIFSAAVPGQGGANHINEQWPSYWVKLFKERDYLCVDALRAKIWNNKRIEPFYRQNMFVFCDSRFLHRYAKLTETQRCTMPLEVVHPDLIKLRDNPGLTVILTSFPRALFDAVARRIKPTWWSRGHHRGLIGMPWLG